jgi:hypothetical protein
MQPFNPTHTTMVLSPITAEARSRCAAAARAFGVLQAQGALMGARISADSDGAPPGVPVS